MRVTVEQASVSDAPLLENLLNLYLYDFSEVHGTAPESDGRFRYPRLPLYFSEANRTPLIIWADGAPAGFALVSRGSLISGAPDVWDLSEFFVVRGLRRRGIGRDAASAVFGQFDGDWEVRVLEQNAGAYAFWPHAIRHHTGDAFEVSPWKTDAGNWTVFRFGSDKRAA